METVQKEMVENGNGKAVFTIDKVTVFSVNVTNAKVDNVSTDINMNPEVKDLDFSDKSLRILELCVAEPRTKKEMLLMVGVTNQTTNIRNIINPLIVSGCLAPVEEDRSKYRNVRYEVTSRGQKYLRYRQSLPSSLETISTQYTRDNSELSLFLKLD